MTGKPAWRFLRPALLVGLPLVAVTATVLAVLIGAGDAAEDGAALVVALHRLADEELRAAIRELDHRRRIQIARGGESGVDGIGADAIDRRQREVVGLGVIEEFLHFGSEEHAGAKSFGVRHG